MSAMSFRRTVERGTNALLRQGWSCKHYSATPLQTDIHSQRHDLPPTLPAAPGSSPSNNASDTSRSSPLIPPFKSPAPLTHQPSRLHPSSQSFVVPGSQPETITSGLESLDAFINLTGGEIIAEMLRRFEVPYIFGYPGGAILPVFDAIHNNPHFKLILTRHEQGAGHMAEGFARASGKPGVVLVTSGPGATNLITPMQDALSDGTPMVVLTGQVPRTALGTDAFQEADIVGISRSCTKWNTMVRDINELPRRIAEAFDIATSGRPGPVLVDLPKDVTAATLRSTASLQGPLPHGSIKRYPARHQHHLEMRSKRLSEALERTRRLLEVAQKPVIYAGQGVMNYSHFLTDFATATQIPVTTTLQGLGVFDEENPLSLHMLGMHGAVYANYAMQEADLILAVGARFDDRVTGNLRRFAPKAREAERRGTGGIVHLEIMPKNINKVVDVTVVLEGDVGTNIQRLMQRLPPVPKSRQRWLDQIQSWKETYAWDRFARAPVEPATAGSLTEGVKPQQAVAMLDKLCRDMKDEVVITTGVGQHQMWAAQYFRWRHPRTFITSGGLGTMGFGLPSALGAKLYHGSKAVVIDVDGDASYCMTAMELMTARQFGIGVKVLILNNDFLGMVKQWQDLFYEERYSGSAMHNPDFVRMAESFGCKGLRISREEELEPVMREFLEYDRNKPIVLDCRVLKEQHVYPMVPAGKALDEMVLGPLPEP